MTREERLMQARRDFERTHTERLRRELVESSDPDARIEFPPMEKIWRNIMHELAADLNLHAESVELDVPAAEGDKYVVVYRKPPEVELTEAEELRRARAAAERRARASAGVRKGEALTDQAPVFAPGETGPEFTVVGTVKRDLRGVAQTSLDMRKRKQEEAERAAENPGKETRARARREAEGRKGRERVRCRNTGARWFRRMCLVNYETYETRESFGARRQRKPVRVRLAGRRRRQPPRLPSPPSPAVSPLARVHTVVAPRCP